MLQCIWRWAEDPAIWVYTLIAFRESMGPGEARIDNASPISLECGEPSEIILINHCSHSAPKDKVAFKVERAKVKIAPLGSRLATSYKAVPALKRPLSLKGMTEIAREDQVQEAASGGL